MNQFYFNLNDYLNTSVKIYGEKNAIITAKQSLNYNDLYNNVICTANLLIVNGIKKGDRVVVCIGNELESVVLFWAVLRVGGIVSLISPELSINKISYVMQDSGAKLLFSSKDTGLKLQDFDSSSLIEYKNIYYEDLLELTKEDFMIKLKSKVIDTDLASIIYTSGSTGEPKGVMMTHKNMLTAAASIINYLEYSSIDNILCCLPLSFDYGLYQMIMAVAVGATLILEKNFTLPLQFLRKIEKYQVTVIPLVPSMVPILINYNAKFNCDLSSVRKVTNTGAA